MFHISIENNKRKLLPKGFSLEPNETKSLSDNSLQWTESLND